MKAGRPPLRKIGSPLRNVRFPWKGLGFHLPFHLDRKIEIDAPSQNQPPSLPLWPNCHQRSLHVQMGARGALRRVLLPLPRLLVVSPPPTSAETFGVVPTRLRVVVLLLVGQVGYKKYRSAAPLDLGAHVVALATGLSF